MSLLLSLFLPVSLFKRASVIQSALAVMSKVANVEFFSVNVVYTVFIH